MSSDGRSVAEDALARLPDRRVASLYDVAVQYATLDWYQTVAGGDVGFDLDPEHLSLLTPAAKAELYDEPENALVVYVDLTGERPRLREDEPVRFETVGWSDRYELGHAYPANKTSSMTDYSLTTHKAASEHHLAGERDDAWGTANVRDRFTRWAHSEAADQVVASYDGDTSVLEALRELGADEDRLREALLDAAPLDPDDEETEHEVFVTVRIRTPETDGYELPGRFPALNEVMAEQKRERFESLNVDDAAGDGTGYVTGERGRVTGGSTGLLGMYGKQQREHFPDLSRDGSRAWQTRPVSLSTAAALATANGVFESFYTPLGDSRRLYVLPYLRDPPSSLEPGTVERFVDEVFERFRETDDLEAAVDDVFYDRDHDRDGDGLGLFVDDQSPLYDHVGVATVFLVSGNPDRVLFQHLDTAAYRPRAFESARARILVGEPFQTAFGDLPAWTGSPLLDTDSRTAAVFFGSDFERTTAPTRSSHAVEGTPRAGAHDDVVTRHLDAFLGGGTVPRSTLLAEYVHEVVQRQREQFGTDDAYAVPDKTIVEQYVQFRALEAVDALRPGRRDGDPVATAATLLHDPESRDETPQTTTPVSDTDTDTDAEDVSREERLQTFVESHPVLDDSEPLQAVFLLGGLVGRISALQRLNGVSSTLTRRYPVDYLTKQSIKEVTKEVLQMNETYIQSEEITSEGYNARYVDRLPDLMLGSDPSSWAVNQNELQWVYALGVAYGKNDRSDGDDTDDESDADETTDTGEASDGDETERAATDQTTPTDT